MFGVVLWSNEQARKAVIWCEDHGDLAYYRTQDNDNSVALTPGDWVEFDVVLSGTQRIAYAPTLINGGSFENLSERLVSFARTASKGRPSLTDKTPPVSEMGKIEPFRVPGNANGAGTNADQQIRNRA